MLGIPFLDNAIWNWFKPQTFDDPVDRLNYFITSTLLTFFAIMVSAKQYVGSPIQCWMPMEFKGGWEQYAEDYCFIQNTFFVPFHEEIPSDDEDRSKAEIGYYQWVPIVLALQAIMFYLPNWIWKTLHQQSGIDLGTAIEDARKLRQIVGADRKKEVGKLASYIEECLEFYSEHRSVCRLFCFRFGRGLGSYVSMLYLFVKFLYLLNIFTQFYILNSFLGSDYTFWGFQGISVNHRYLSYAIFFMPVDNPGLVECSRCSELQLCTFRDLWNGREWLDSGVFPRVTMCDFKIRRLANTHKYTVQCVLMINMFNEKIYLFIWFWFLFVAISTGINFVYCFVQLVFTSLREKSTRTWLSGPRYGESTTTDDFRHEHILRRFAHAALRPDGILLLRFIEGHAGAIVVRELAAKLFTDYLEQKSYPGHSHSTKSTSPGIIDDGPHENLYNTDKIGGLMAPDYPTKPI
ncbi:innexin-3 domain protein [Dictyocaulus viviparus]|uniref:Innexin n=1 Tax=Dictyocaulus viviparus TaxID=29172 RepID=A0A0D8XE47_DICVI|nr:innexin-3 domain protein [Dictyocaulus viviparus]